jgi:hypothetical protein
MRQNDKNYMPIKKLRVQRVGFFLANYAFSQKFCGSPAINLVLFCPRCGTRGFQWQGWYNGYWWSGFVPILKTHGTVWVFGGSDWSDIRLF